MEMSNLRCNLKLGELVCLKDCPVDSFFIFWCSFLLCKFLLIPTDLWCNKAQLQTLVKGGSHNLFRVIVVLISWLKLVSFELFYDLLVHLSVVCLVEDGEDCLAFVECAEHGLWVDFFQTSFSLNVLVNALQLEDVYLCKSPGQLHFLKVTRITAPDDVRLMRVCLYCRSNDSSKLFHVAYVTISRSSECL